MKKNCKERIGYSNTFEIMEHKWFDEIEWEKLHNLEIEPPILPVINGKFDLQNFNKIVQKGIIIRID